LPSLLHTGGGCAIARLARPSASYFADVPLWRGPYSMSDGETRSAILRTYQRWVIAQPREASQSLFSRCVESAEPLSASFVPLASVSSFAVVCSFPCPSCHPCLPYPLLSAIRCRDRRPHETLISSRTSDASIVAGPASQEMSRSIQPARREPPDAGGLFTMMLILNSVDPIKPVQSRSPTTRPLACFCSDGRESKSPDHALVCRPVG